MIKVLMLDDETAPRLQMERLLAEHVPQVTDFYSTSDPVEAKQILGMEKPQLLILDVEMPAMSGFDFLESLSERNFAVIFSTAYSKYAVQALRFSAIDFLLKPVQAEELKAAMERFLRQPVVLDQLREMYQQLFKNLKSKSEQQFKLTLTRGSRLYFIAPVEIAFCAADDNYTIVHTIANEQFTISRTLRDVEEMLAPHGFIRVHKSSLVNKNQVDHLEAGETLLLRNGLRITVSRRRLDEVKTLLGKG